MFKPGKDAQPVAGFVAYTSLFVITLLTAVTIRDANGPRWLNYVLLSVLTIAASGIVFMRYMMMRNEKVYLFRMKVLFTDRLLYSKLPTYKEMLNTLGSLDLKLYFTDEEIHRIENNIEYTKHIEP